MTTHVSCGACGQAADDFAGAIPFYLPNSEITTDLWRCRDCGTYTRDIDLDDPILKRHFDVASYTDPAEAERFRSVRSGYFEFLARLLCRQAGGALEGKRVLDIGSAYGHFLECLIDKGAAAEGMEIVESLRHDATRRGLMMHASLPEKPDSPYDMITVIDSLYYVNDPLATLQRLRELLSPRGCLLLRVANRCWLLDLARSLGVPIHRDRFGDAKYNFTPEGLILLLKRAGFQVDDVIWAESGKADPRAAIRMYYRAAPLLSDYLSLRVAPGMLVIARPGN